MRELKISYGNSSQSRTWKNVTITWDDLCRKLKATKRTAETVEQYHAMSRKEKDAAKDTCCFVCGHLKDGRRLVQNVEFRSCLALDSDKAPPGFIEKYRQECTYISVIYTTHGHTPESPRVRIIVLLDEDISPDLYPIVARYYAAEWGIDYFDVCSYKVNQPMFLPTTPADGEFICHVIEGECLNPTKFLSQYPDWQDLSKLPVSSEEKNVRVVDGRKQEDPLTKEGIVGAFCRTYDIESAIEKFLSNVYEPSVREGRYDYIPGEGSAGIVIYEDKFAYSHHGTDPAGGRLLNAFDLVRMHLFLDEDETASFQKMCTFSQKDALVAETLKQEQIEKAQKDFEEITSNWPEPIPFGRHYIMQFPTDALPPNIRGYVVALSQSVQAPVDMAACASIGVMSTTMQGKYKIRGKPDWEEPENTFCMVIAYSSERKSAIHHGMTKPIVDYEKQYNIEHAAAVNNSQSWLRTLEKKQRVTEDQFVKGKATKQDLELIAKEIADYVPEKELKLFTDDTTPEKLVSLLVENNERMALLSSEAGMFDLLTGNYSSMPNLDGILKSYSGDPVKVDRIGRPSENLYDPALTILVMAQPGAAQDVVSNKRFRKRGIPARFLYSFAQPLVGEREFWSIPIPQEVKDAYTRQIRNMLEDPYTREPEIITLSTEAAQLLAEFHQEIEPRLKKEYAEFADWGGKLLGNTLRISGLLLRASVIRDHDFDEDDAPPMMDIPTPAPLVVDGETMRNAILIGKYFLNHAQAVFNVLPEDAMFQSAHKILEMIVKKGLTEFDRRTAMRNCQMFKRVEEIQPVLDFLEDYGYIAALPAPQNYGKGRPPMPRYLVNPWVHAHYCQPVIDDVMRADDRNQG